jgi:hypothetical protein
MSWQALIVILALALSIVGAPSIRPELGYLDHGANEYGIERSSDPILLLGMDMPCLNQFLCKSLPLSLDNTSNVIRPLFLSFLLACQDERPPTG